MKRKLLFFSGDRSEFGLQEPVIAAARLCNSLEISLLVYGNHLDDSANFSSLIDAKIPLQDEEHTLSFTPRIISKVIHKVAMELERIKPDMLVLYGDRFETFAAAIASTQMRIPTAHIEGGDITEGGTLDDSVRHAITKLVHLHFATNQDSMQRILKLGEEPWRVFNVGLPAIDSIRKGKFATPTEIAEELKLDLSRPIVVFTQHSVMSEVEQLREHFLQSVEAIRELMHQGVQVVLTYPNKDLGSEIIIEEIKRLELENHQNLRVKSSLGSHFYYGILGIESQENCRVVCAGNSSSGIKETQSFGCPAVNIGPRQRGRLRGGNVIEVEHYDWREIVAAVNTALFDEEFRKSLKSTVNPYYQGGASEKIIEVLLHIEINQGLLDKRITF